MGSGFETGRPQPVVPGQMTVTNIAPLDRGLDKKERINPSRTMSYVTNIAPLDRGLDNGGDLGLDFVRGVTNIAPLDRGLDKAPGPPLPRQRLVTNIAPLDRGLDIPKPARRRRCSRGHKHCPA